MIRSSVVAALLCATVVGCSVTVAGALWGCRRDLHVVLADPYSSNIIGRITTSDVLLVSPVLAFAGVGLAAVTAYVTLRLYVRE